MLSKISLLSLLSLFLFAPLLGASQEKKRDLKKYNLGKSALALQGYDPVAYFKEGGGKPAKGKKDLTVEHAGVTYRFATEENRERFRKDPERFEPAYGGWCAYAMAKGQTVEVDPKSFLIQGGRLMVFYKGLFNDTRKKWSKDAKGLEPKADKTWKKHLAKDA